MDKRPRQVGLKTIFDLVKQRRAYLIIGIVFTLIPIFSIATFLFASSTHNSGIPKVDYEQIDKDGQPTKAIITKIEIEVNTTINDEHPSIISFRYSIGDKEVENRYESLAPYKISSMAVGDTVMVKYLGENSMIIGLDPFEFPLDGFLTIMIPFFIIGIITLTLLYLKVKKEINLYQFGEIKDAEIISMSAKSALPISGIGKGLTIYYRYETTEGKTIVGESFTNDYSILKSKGLGDFVKIFVSPSNESKSCLITKLDQIRNNWKIV